MKRFVGRQEELNGLKGLLRKRSSSLVVVWGRRRIGKSRLIEEYSHLFEQAYLFTGIPPEKGTTAQDQRDIFAAQMRRFGISVRDATSWYFLLIDVAEHCAKGRILVVLDEITWMGGLDPTFLPIVKTVWDTHFKANDQLVMVISGSNSAWIEKNILSSTGFVGRFSHYLRLRELPLVQCNEFWGELGNRIAPYEKFKILSVIGGVPRYLEEIRTDLSAEQNILRLAYEPTGILFAEFDQIFSDLFAHRNAVYKGIVQAVASGSRTQKEIAVSTSREFGGDIGGYLDDLVEAGFLARDHTWNLETEKTGRLGHYRICDNYVRFYLRYVEPYKAQLRSGSIHALPKGWKSILGLQFENLVCNNSLALLKALGLPPGDVVWLGPYRQTATAKRAGCQIDYLIQTQHKVLYLCEVKFSDQPVGSEVVAQMAQKAERLHVPRGFSVRHVLIHVNGVADSVAWDRSISNIVDFGQLLNPSGSQPAAAGHICHACGAKM